MQFAEEDVDSSNEDDESGNEDDDDDDFEEDMSLVQMVSEKNIIYTESEIIVL